MMLNWRNSVEWRKYHPEAEALMTVVPRELHGRSKVREAKMRELGLVEQAGVFKEVEGAKVLEGGEDNIIDCTWVIMEKEVNGVTVTKARLCARGFQEKTEVRKDSPTVSKIGI